MSFFLVTTADERTWKFDRPVLFLGEWCRLYDRRHVWEGMDAVVAAPYGLSVEQKKRDIEYIENLTGQLLKELARALNLFHNTRHNLRYWNIVLGHWLNRYVAVAFNRYFTLEQALRNYEVSGTTIFESADYSLATADSMDFIWACNDDVWNHVLYSKILNCWGNIEVELDSDGLRGISGFSLQKNNSILASKAVANRFIMKVARKILPKLSRKNDAFIINSYLSFKEEIKLQLSLGQWPQLWQSPTLITVASIQEKRHLFRIDAEKFQGFDRFVRLLLSEIIPTCYLEGYNQMVQQVKSLPWPRKPKFIFTSNNFDTDEIFKAWAASKTEEGVSYFTGQHGSNYGTNIYAGNSCWPERSAADKFFSWGWSDSGSNVVPAFKFQTYPVKLNRYDANGGLLLIDDCAPWLYYPWDVYFEFGVYQQEQFHFVSALPKTIQQKLTVRLHRAYRHLRWFDEQRWQDRSPQTKIETGSVPIQQLISQSRLVVHSYDSTGILETLTLNTPTLCFWHGGLGCLLPEAKPYYELLRDANILADTPEQAAKFITSHWDKLSGWWKSSKVQDARNVFCDRYARIENKPVRTLQQLLTNHANQGKRI